MTASVLRQLKGIRRDLEPLNVGSDLLTRLDDLIAETEALRTLRVRARAAILPQRQPGIDLAALRDDLAKLNGAQPYNSPANTCWNDAYFAKSLEQKYSAPINVLEAWAKHGGER